MTIIAISGPTASGKSKLAFELAQRLSGCILNADARQIYQGLPILTACPREKEKREIEHYLYEYCTPPHIGSAGMWVHKARETLKNLSHRVVFIVGGTGLYFSALFEGLSPIPEIDPMLREDIHHYVHERRQEAWAELQACDPAWAQRIHPRNTQRLVRGLEVFKATGRPLSHFFSHTPRSFLQPDFALLLLPEKSQVKHWARERFEHMFEEGVLEEVLQFSAPPLHPLAKTIGLRPIQSYIQGNISREVMFTKALQETNAYIKRQYTWFRAKMQEPLWHRVSTPEVGKDLVLRNILI